jgi:hypothetical protein
MAKGKAFKFSAVMMVVTVAAMLLLAMVDARQAKAQDASVEITDEPDPVQVGERVTSTVNY